MRVWICVFVVIWAGTLGLRANTAQSSEPSSEIRVRALWIEGGSSPASWELLEIELPPSAAQESAVVQVQDARGGLSVARSCSGGRVLVPMPLVQPGALGSYWRLDVRVRDSSGSRPLTRTTFEIPLGGSSADPLTFRVAVSPGFKRQAEEAAAVLRGRTAPIVALEIPEEEILSGSPLLFSTCDAIYLSQQLAGRLDQKRALALISAGIQFISTGDHAPAGELSHFVWESVPSKTQPATQAESQSPLWYFPDQRIERPTLIEPALARLVGENGLAGDVWASLSPKLNTSLLLVGPISVVVVLLAWGLFKRSWVRFLASAIALTAITMITLTYLRSADIAASRSASWQHIFAGKRAITAVSLEESLTAYSPLFAHNWSSFGHENQLLLPLSRSPREYWSGSSVQLTLPGAAHASDPTQLTAPLPARGVQRFSTRAAFAAGLMPVFPASPEDRQEFTRRVGMSFASGFWLIEGYVYPGTSSTFQPENRQPFSAWAGSQLPALQSSLNAWYELRFDARHRYFLWIDPGAGFRVIDFPE